MLNPVLLLLAAFGLLAAFDLGRTLRPLARYLAPVILAGLAVSFSLHLLNDLPSASLVVPMGPMLLRAVFRLDDTAALFGLIFCLSGAPLLIFARHPRRLPPGGLALLLFCLLVPLAESSPLLLFGWEMAGLTAALLLTASAPAAARLYGGFVLFSGLALTAGLLLPPEARWLAPPLLIAAAAAKAGLAPLHVWLIPAHAGAPAGLSALLSGTVTKLGLYLLIRYGISGSEIWSWGWGLLLAVAGLASALAATLTGLRQSGLKTVLAASTLDHVGLITLWIGLAVFFRASGNGAAELLAAVGAILHLAGHASLKTLAFSAAGLLGEQKSSETPARLPVLLLLTAMAGLCGLPVLPVFSGEWYGLQSLIRIEVTDPAILRLTAPLLIAALGAVSALTLAFMLRGIALPLLAGKQQANAIPPGKQDRVALLLMGLTALLTGLLPLQWLLPKGMIPEGIQFNPILLLFLVVLPYGILRLRRGTSRSLPAWSTGTPRETLPQASADGLSEPLMRLLQPLKFGPSKPRSHIRKVEKIIDLIMILPGFFDKLQLTHWPQTALLSVLGLLLCLMAVSA